MQNPYEILGVEKSASQADIKTAYRRMAMKHHPDRAQDEGSVEKFKEAKTAYEFLSDDKKRSAFDAGRVKFGDNQTSNQFDEQYGNIDDIFRDIFSQTFRSGQGQRKKRHSNFEVGGDIEIQVEIDFEQSMLGHEMDVNANIPATCLDCEGSGAKDNNLIKCSNCDGRGAVAASFVGMNINRECQACDGRGEIPKEECNTCYGKGQILEDRLWNIKIPAGCPDGAVMVLTGVGVKGTKSSGDLHIRVMVKEDDLFKRDGLNVIMPLPLRATRAILGGSVEIKTWEGKFEVKIPEGTSHGDVLSFKNKGAYDVYNNKRRGNLNIIIDIETPKNISKEQRDLLERLDVEFENKKHSGKKKRSFWDKIQDTLK